MRDLERRYTRLLRLCYPVEYRRARGTELVGTYLELAAPERRWPSAADAVDLAAGGTRQRLRAAESIGLGDGFRLAAGPALLTTSAFAAGWSVLELRPPPSEWGIPGFGPFASSASSCGRCGCSPPSSIWWRPAGGPASRSASRCSARSPSCRSPP